VQIDAKWVIEMIWGKLTREFKSTNGRNYFICFIAAALSGVMALSGTLKAEVQQLSHQAIGQSNHPLQ